ncbi:adenosine kinase [Novosphingobium guangzhouense]|uniref:Carbohydrate kinase n=1 Tax=Novosphingobium guangzhouense TaxID=1850347 RepID=A0A2K2FSA9_9SPHN|nr:adenosine kinase [Novosphingobium guangzhouense]PNU01675.1 carbohydrate kinase [Novosphingobium guangzhouense]
MTQPRLDVIAVGNAIIDVIGNCSDAKIDELGLAHGGMQLIDADQARTLYDAMGPAREISGGSAANTLAGLAALGAKCGFIGQVAEDQLGEVFTHDIRAGGIEFDVPARAGETPTARCLIFVTPDGQRTMNTFLGASHLLSADMVADETIADAAVLYLEGYLWDPVEPRAAMRKAIAAARAAGRKIAFTPSESFIIDMHRGDFLSLIEEGLIDLLFCNETELATLTGLAGFEDGIAMLAPKVSVLVVTKGADGAVALSGGERAQVAAQPIDRVVDTTGAGDLFAAGFLFGHVRGKGLEESLKMGAICASEIISHYGARPECDLADFVAARM